MQLIVLWDIDHTLIENAGVSKEIYATAFAALTRVSPSLPASTEGRTDRLIMRDMFRRHDLPEPDWPTIEAALTRAGGERFDDLRRRGVTLPGVRDALKAASVQAGWVSSVLTGNIAANARVKLAAFDLDPLLDLAVGAYGADAEQRPDLVAVARERVHRDRGLSIDVPVVLVGDTPRDVEAALATGSGIIAVATGIHSQAELEAAGASVVLPDLSDTAGLLIRLESFAAR
ncbi:haloacid dehalogenase-like hydrolase [Sphaerisporangium sp. NPDC051011]|uniref:HAD family hydrolase n=1 Tax=Sphaerisporangium sp. NPDC051011 TaxID=3155792 RepID=UPI0033DB3D7B